MIQQGACNSFRVQLLSGVHDFSTDHIYIALYYESATLGVSTTVYTSTGEVSGSGYASGGQLLTGQTILSTNGVAWVSWNDVTWTVDAGFYARGCLIYNASKGNKAVMVLDFGLDRYSSNGSFMVRWPPNPSLNAVLRIT